MSKRYIRCIMKKSFRDRLHIVLIVAAVAASGLSNVGAVDIRPVGHHVLMYHSAQEGISSYIKPINSKTSKFSFCCHVKSASTHQARMLTQISPPLSRRLHIHLYSRIADSCHYNTSAKLRRYSLQEEIATRRPWLGWSWYGTWRPRAGRENRRSIASSGRWRRTAKFASGRCTCSSCRSFETTTI